MGRSPSAQALESSRRQAAGEHGQEAVCIRGQRLGHGYKESGFQVAVSDSGSPPASQADSRLNLDIPDWMRHRHQGQLGQLPRGPLWEPGPKRATCLRWAVSHWPQDVCWETPMACLPPPKSLLGRAQPLLWTLTHCRLGLEANHEIPVGSKRETTIVGTAERRRLGTLSGPWTFATAQVLFLTSAWLVSWSSSILPGWPTEPASLLAGVQALH